MTDPGQTGANQPLAITSRIETAAALLAAIVASSSDAILSKSLDGIITSWNDATERLFGYTAAEMIGQSIRRLIPADRQSEEDRILERIAAGERVENYETVRLHKSGRPIDVSVTISPVRDLGGNILGASKIVRDISTRKRAEESAALLSAIVASSFDGIVSKSLEGIVTSWNRAAERIFGYTAAEMVGQPIRRLIPRDRQFEEDDILRRIARGETLESIETVRLHKNGQHLHVSVTISPIRDASGAVRGASKIVRDITDRKRAEEQIRLLMAEVNHRTKNLLGLVQAIARQTASSSTEEFLAGFGARLQALATNQDLLIKNDFADIAIDELVAAQLAPFAGLMDSRIQVAGRALRLQPNAAQQIGMALHELQTNAAKYGSLANESGQVHITWDATGEEFVMTWTESDGPPAGPQMRDGYGSRILTSLVPESLAGTGVLELSGGGLAWRLTCPADNVVERGARGGVPP